MPVRHRFILPGRTIGAILGVVSFLLSCWPLAGQSSAFDCRTSSKTCTINIASQNPSKDEKTTGPKKIVVKGANTLRYDFQFNPTVTFTPGPKIDLATLGTTSSIPASNKDKATAKSELNSMEAAVSEVFKFDIEDKKTDVDNLDSLEHDTNGLITATNEASVLVSRAAEDTQNLLESSDSILKASEPALKDEINSRQIDKNSCPADAKSLTSTFKRGVCAKWPEQGVIDDLIFRAKTLQAHVKQDQQKASTQLEHDEERIDLIKEQGASRINSWIKDHKVNMELKLRADDELDRLNTILKTLADLTEGGKSSSDFHKAQNGLFQWNDRLVSLAKNQDAFTLPIQKAPCTFTFSQTKTIKEELLRTDRLGSPPAQADSSSKKPPSSNASTTIPLITVECSSPFVMSAGFGFSSITERDFVISKDASGQNRFATDARSNFHPLPLAMVNMRYKEFNRFWALYGSFGVAANIKGQSAGGSDPEYLFTPITFGFFRTAFISPALHIGREVRLGSNFHEGDVVPSNITTPPLQKSYKMGIGIAVTFTKP